MTPEQTREQKLINMAALTLCDPENVEDAEPGTEGHREPWEPWSAPVMILAGYATAADSDGGLMPWLYLACRCGWWLGYGPQYDPAGFAKVTAAHGERCELAPGSKEEPLTGVPMVCTACRNPVADAGPGLWEHEDPADTRIPCDWSTRAGAPVKAMVAAGNENVPLAGTPLELGDAEPATRER